MRIYKRHSGGFTLVELITVLVILSVIASIAIPSCVGFIEKTKEKRHVLEAQEVRRSIDLYLIDHYDMEMNGMILLFELSSTSLDSPKNPLAGYLTVKCSKGATIENLSLDTKSLRIIGLIYCADGYRIEIDGSDISVTRYRTR